MFLSNTLPTKENDFQDYKLWRTINYEMLKNIYAEFEVIIVPMTITNLQYYDEIVGRLQRNGMYINAILSISFISINSPLINFVLLLYNY